MTATASDAIMVPVTKKGETKRVRLMVEHHSRSPCFRALGHTKTPTSDLKGSELIKWKLFDWLTEWNIHLYPADQIDNSPGECDYLQQFNKGIFEACYFVPVYHPTRPTILLSGIWAIRMTPNAHPRGRVWDDMERLPSYRKKADEADQVLTYHVDFFKMKGDDDTDYEDGIPEPHESMKEAEFVKKYTQQGLLDLLKDPTAEDPYMHTACYKDVPAN